LHEYATGARGGDLLVTAFNAFMANLIDYAGLFPPAALSVPAAVAEFAEHQKESDVWMLGRFIAPVARLAEIGSVANPYLHGDENWEFSGLIGDRAAAAEAVAKLSDQGQLVKAFESEQAGRMRVTSLEAAIPRDGAESPAEFIAEFLAAMTRAGLDQRELYLEVMPGSDDDKVLTAIAAASVGREVRLGAKLRCGGVTPEAFPSVERIATVIHRCAALNLPLKCTAGLHHPVRHQAEQPHVMMHGFLNVFGAGMMAWAEKADVATLIQCVAETDPSAFKFEAAGFSWRDHHIDKKTLSDIRHQSLAGFGSCSFTEPRADLQNLGML